MATFDNQWFKEVGAIFNKANGLKQEPPQNNHAAPYVAPVDYGMYSCWTDTAPSEYAPPDFDLA